MLQCGSCLIFRLEAAIQTPSCERLLRNSGAQTSGSLRNPSGRESNPDSLSEVKIYNRCAPGCVFARADATRLAFAPFNGDLNFALLCCRPEPGLRVGIRVLT